MQMSPSWRSNRSFCCSGSDGYFSLLDDVLDIRSTANTDLDPQQYDFRVISSAHRIARTCGAQNEAANKARVVAGYCWPWPSKNDPAAYDIVMPGARLPPPMESDTRWQLGVIMAPESVAQVGCIHTCQGLEVDYVGVLIGPDLVYRKWRGANRREGPEPSQTRASKASVL